MAPDHPTVAVVVPYSPKYTPAEMLAEAEESVAAQTVPTDLVVVDDVDTGPADARNAGLDRTDARYVAFLDADDLWEPDKLERQLDRMAETGAGLCVAGEPRSRTEFVHDVFVGDLTAVTSSVLVDRERVGTRFETDLVRNEDLLFVLEAATEGGVCLCPGLFERRVHEESMMQSGIDPETYLDQSNRFAHLVSHRVPDAGPYLTVHHVQTLTTVGLAYHREGAYDDAVTYFGRALRVSPHPYTAWFLLRSLLRRALW